MLLDWFAGCAYPGYREIGGGSDTDILGVGK